MWILFTIVFIFLLLQHTICSFIFWWNKDSLLLLSSGFVACETVNRFGQRLDLSKAYRSNSLLLHSSGKASTFSFISTFINLSVMVVMVLGGFLGRGSCWYLTPDKRPRLKIYFFWKYLSDLSKPIKRIQRDINNSSETYSIKELRHGLRLIRKKCDVHRPSVSFRKPSDSSFFYEQDLMKLRGTCTDWRTAGRVSSFRPLFWKLIWDYKTMNMLSLVSLIVCYFISSCFSFLL